MNRISDKYDIIGEVASGEFAKVFRAKDIVLDRIVLLKLMHREITKDDSAAERFRREAKISASIAHPNIVRVYEYGMFDGQPYIVFEWIDGVNLYEYIHRRGAIDLEEAIVIFASILQGLAAIHKAGIVHRDLKPENVMIDNMGKVKLTDFSLSFSNRMTRITKHGDLVGSPGYLSPEVIVGDEHTVKSDIFAAGLIMWELLTGENPFEADDIFQTLQQVQEAKLPDIDGMRGDVPLNLKELLYSMLAKNPDDRPGSVEEVLNELHSSFDTIFNQREDLNSSISIPDRIPRKGRSKWVERIPFITFGIMVVLALLISGWFWSRQDEVVTVNDIDSLKLAMKDSHRRAEQSSLEKKEPSTGVVNSDSISMVHLQPTVDELSFPSGSIPSISEGGATLPDDKVHSAGYLYFRINPWARIYVDGVYRGESPLDLPLKLISGEHRIILDNPYFPRLNFSCSVLPNDTSVFEVNMFNHIGSVTFDVQPWGYIELDGMRMGVSPLPKPLYLAPGRYKLKIDNPNFKLYKRTLEVMAGDEINLVVDLEAGKDSIMVSK